MTPFGRSTLLVAACLAAFHQPASAQDFDRLRLSVWAGGLDHEVEERLPFSPVLAVRWERAAFRGLRLGGELGTVIANRRSDCVHAVGVNCNDGVALTVVPTLAGLVQLEGGSGRVRPYIGASFGSDIGRMSMIRGLGVGVRFPDALLGGGVSLEARHRTDGRLDDDGGGAWEILLGAMTR